MNLGATDSTWRRWRRDLGHAEFMTAYQQAADAAVGSIS